MVAIVTDSAANLPSAMARALGVQVVPMYLKFGERVYRDGADLTPTDFYRRLQSDRVAAFTSTPSPGDFLEAYRRAGQREVVCVTVASVMSAAYHEAMLAAERWDGRVEVVDSLSASMAEGFVALEAGRLAAEGASLEEVAAAARALAPRTSLFATVDTFEFLQKSGRVNRLQAYAATMLDIRPVFKFQHGEVASVARPRTKRRALDRIALDSLAEIGGRPVHLAAIHAAAAQEATWLIDRISASANVVEQLVVEVTPVIGVHTGPGLAGTAFYCDGDKLAG